MEVTHALLLTHHSRRQAERIPGDQVEAFGSSLRGELLTPQSPGYEAARTVWNAMVERRPGLIARCAGEADVIQALAFARSHALLVAIRGGGHNIAGHGLCDGGLVIDLSPMRAIHIDPDGRTAQVEPGCTLGDVDHDAQIFGLATPVGINSTTGIAGLTLGGGFGWLSRKHGLTADNLIAAEVVTAAGRVVRASGESEPDLFWALRGGGGNFGVVTSFTFRLHPVGPTVLAGLVVHPLGDAPELLRFYRDFVLDLPDETTVWVVLRKAPPLPFLPEEWHGREILAFAAFQNGAIADGERVLAPLRRRGRPIADAIALQPYAAWQQAFDPVLTPGARNYWKSHDFTELSDGAIVWSRSRARTIRRTSSGSTTTSSRRCSHEVARGRAGACALPRRHQQERHVRDGEGATGGRALRAEPSKARCHGGPAASVVPRPA
jgi:FAD/FMN-containing dehydrogenase